MSQGGLPNLAWLSAEHKLCENLDYYHLSGKFPWQRKGKKFIE